MSCLDVYASIVELFIIVALSLNKVKRISSSTALQVFKSDKSEGDISFLNLSIKLDILEINIFVVKGNFIIALTIKACV